MRKFAGDGFNPGAGYNREHELLRLQSGAQVAQDGTQALWFDGQNNYGVLARAIMPERNCLSIGFDHPDAVFAFQFLSPVGARMAA
jgi:hypothetical protein